MYEVYSQQRPGRPRWTWGASAIVLLATIALAAAVVQRKSRSLAADLTAPQIFPRGQLRCAVPAGWKLLPEGDLKSGVALTAEEPAEHGLGRKLIVFREISRPFGTPLGQGLIAVKQALASRHHLEDTGVLEVVPSRVGPFPACDTVVAATPVGGGGPIFMLYRFAIAPAGEAIGLVLQVQGQLSSRDRRLLDELSKTVELLDVQPAKDGTAALREAGLSFDLPRDVSVFADARFPSGCIQLMGGTDEHGWYLTLDRVPLLADRNPSAIVRDLGLSMLERTELPDEIQTDRLGTRAVAQLRLSVDSDRPKSVLLLCAQTDPQTAVLMIGRYESEGFDEVSRLARTIAEKATVSSYQERMDLEKAQATARSWLNNVATRGMKSIWGDYETKRAEFSIRLASLTLATVTRVLTSERKGNESWWELRADYQQSFSRSLDVCRLRDDARKSECVSVTSEAGHDRRYIEKWTAGGAIHRELSIADAEPRASTIDADDLFASEPLLFEAAASLAGGKTHAVFSSTEMYTPGLVYWTLTPLGNRPLPGDSSKQAQATLIQRDFDPRPIVLYFDDRHELNAISFMDGRYQIRTRQSARGGTAE